MAKDLMFYIESDIACAVTVLFLSGILVLTYLVIPTFNGLPTGPWGLPVIGHLHLFGETPQLTFQKWRKRYGDVFLIRMGSWQTVVINGSDAIKEAMLKNDAFQSRPRFYSMVQVNNMEDLAFGEYNARWLLHHKIAKKAFRQFAVDPLSEVAQMIVKEAKYSVDELLSVSGKPVDPFSEIRLAVGSIVYQLCFGKGKNVRQDEEFCTRISHIQEFHEFIAGGNPIDVMPWLGYVMYWHKRRFDRYLTQIKAERERKVLDHIKTFDRKNIRDITDALLQEDELTDQNDKDEVGLTSQQLLSSLDGILGAGINTVATTLVWAIKLLAMFPEIQDKVQKEILAVVGKSKDVLESDQNSLPYTEATILEVMRFTSDTPFAVPHCTVKKTRLQNYVIPKGTVALVNLHSVAHEESVWGDPNVFRPERFLTDRGTIHNELANSFFPFGLGTRRCFGENVAKLEIFLFLSTYLQHCTFEKPHGVKFDTKGTLGLTYYPTKFNVVIKRH